MTTEAKNPAAPQPLEAARSERPRIPMSLPVARLSVPDIPGFHLHWFLGEMRVQRALQAGYQFVSEDETHLNDRSSSGGEGRDLGTRVSQLAGEDLDQQGQPQRLYLMKLPTELWDQDCKALEDSSSGMLEALKAGIPAQGGDNSNRYSGQQTRLRRDERANHNVFQPVKRSG